MSGGRTLAGVAAGLGAGALWGLVFVAPRMVHGYSAVDLTAGRFLAYGAVAALLMLWSLRRRALPTVPQALAAAGMSLLGFTGYYLLLVLAIRDAGTEVPTLVIGTIPIWVMLLGKPGHLKWGALLPGLALTAAGLALMVGTPHGAGAAGASSDFARGVVYAVASLVCWTAFALVNSAWLKKHPQVQATEWANWLGVATGLGALALWAVAGSPAPTLLAQPDRGMFLALAVATGFGSAWLATILWNIASRRLSASLCGQLIVSETLFALLYSFAWDGQWPSPAQLTACVLFTLGILASIKAHR
ncbi:DMT family transporter [Ramlibacter sp. Leaf400]|uniref:DMT family transporter n=1 Tax=Ramlibacter sp. Leaf400 TaxID=1736365 RepID=UPI0006F4D791|nr:DMT family transporter [Ramlibacter sp. Leaf400]KQT13587.1 transporter [Ramlibacter sp. Leaf400]